jgi:hypothetical protein
MLVPAGLARAIPGLLLRDRVPTAGEIFIISHPKILPQVLGLPRGKGIRGLGSFTSVSVIVLSLFGGSGEGASFRSGFLAPLGFLNGRTVRAGTLLAPTASADIRLFGGGSFLSELPLPIQFVPQVVLGRVKERCPHGDAGLPSFDILVIHKPLVVLVIFEDISRIPGGTIRSPQHRSTCQLRSALREQHVGIRLGKRVVDGTRSRWARFQVRIRLRVGISQGFSLRGEVVVGPRVIITVRGVTVRIISGIIFTAVVATVTIPSVVSGVVITASVSTTIIASTSISSVIPRVMIVRFLGSTVVSIGPLVAIVFTVRRFVDGRGTDMVDDELVVVAPRDRESVVTVLR